MLFDKMRGRAENVLDGPSDALGRRVSHLVCACLSSPCGCSAPPAENAEARSRRRNAGLHARCARSHNGSGVGSRAGGVHAGHLGSIERGVVNNADRRAVALVNAL
jgi:hypothetical protein